MVEEQCHELLLRLGGRLSQRWLWRFRDWLAAGAVSALAHALPLTLLRERVPLTRQEFAMLMDSVAGHGVDPGWLLGIEQVDVAPSPRYRFSDAPPAGHEFDLGDQAAGVLAAVLNGHPDVQQWWLRWRQNDYHGQIQRVLLVRTGGTPARLTGQLQRVCRALGDPYPSVEVFLSTAGLSDYHSAALRADDLVADRQEVMR